MKKNLIFYKLVFKKSEQSSLFQEDYSTLADKVAELSNNHSEADKIQIVQNKIFQLHSFDKHHIFGSFGKIEDLENGDHIRGRNKNNLSIEKLSHLIESFSYFYIDLSDNDMVLMKRSGLPDIKQPLENFLSSHFRVSSLWNIKVVPSITSDISLKYGVPVTVKKLKYTIENDKIPDNEYISAKEAFNLSNDDMRKVTVSIILKDGTETVIDKVSDFFKNYSEFQLENDSETLDLVDKLLIKKVTIEIDSDKLNDYSEIKEILKQQLINFR